MRAIMYHYVREFDPAFPNFRFLHVENFRRQLDHLGETYGFVSREEWDSFLRDGRLPEPAGKVILTFDDALDDHHAYVFPELVRRGLWGIFYAPSAPFVHGTILDVHRVHLLCGAFEGSVLFNTAMQIVTDDMLAGERGEAFDARAYASQANEPGVSEFKHLVNYLVTPSSRTGFLDLLSASLKVDPRETNHYLSPGQIREMIGAGMVFGAHTVTHPVLSALPREAQRREIEDSLAFVSRFSDQGPVTFSHPFGTIDTFNEDTLDLLQAAGVDFAFAVESRQITTDDLERARLRFPRFDCNEYPFGKAD